MGRYTMKLKFPPVPVSGDGGDPSEVIEELLSQGISINGFAEDIPQKYFPRSSNESALTSNQLIVYRQDKHPRKVRSMIRKYQDLLDSGELSVEGYDSYNEQASEIFRAWSSSKFGRLLPEFQYTENMAMFPFRLLIYKRLGKPVHALSILRFGNKSSIGVHNIGTTRGIYPSLNFSMLSVYEFFRAFKTIQDINAGSSRSPGIDHAKSRLKCEYKKVRRIKPYIEMIKETWEQYHPSRLSTDTR